jgi:hypothetical protein
MFRTWAGQLLQHVTAQGAKAGPLIKTKSTGTDLSLFS